MRKVLLLLLSLLVIVSFSSCSNETTKLPEGNVSNSQDFDSLDDSRIPEYVPESRMIRITIVEKEIMSVGETTSEQVLTTNEIQLKENLECNLTIVDGLSLNSNDDAKISVNDRLINGTSFLVSEYVNDDSDTIEVVITYGDTTVSGPVLLSLRY